jgi:serine/threonine protein phosphatase PrpC
VSDELQPPPDSSSPPAAAEPSGPTDVETVPLPTRTPADAADVFFQVRQVDGPAAARSGTEEPTTTPTVVAVGQDLTGRLNVSLEPPVDRFGDDWPVSFAFNHHQVAGSGEDSEPILRTGRDVGLVGVFDGMGGAGGTVYDTPDGPRSGAYLASRVARDVAEGVLVDWLNSSEIDPADSESDSGSDAGDTDSTGAQVAQLLQQSVQQALQDRLTELRAPTSRLRSKLLRALPTTMAVVVAHRRPDTDRAWNCEVLWAGDSRMYALDAAGLHQLTVDDIRDHGDAMANLHEDSVVSNAMSADTPFVVNHRQVQLDEPVVLIAATDGCFGYLPSPMHFEHLLLAGLHDAQTATQWSDAVRRAIVAVAGDDASMVVAVVGADLDALKALTADRLRVLRQQCIEPLDAAAVETDRLAAELEHARQRQAQLSAELWTAYRPDYSRYLSNAEPKDGS